MTPGRGKKIGPREESRPPIPRPFPKKRFGQHFLADENTIRKILRAAQIAPGDRVLEIGPGTGALTEALLDAGAEVTAIEVDRDLAAFLREKFTGKISFRLLEADALKTSFTDLSKGIGSKLKCVSNLPYNISGPMLVKFIEEREAFTRLVLMFQKEVADRIVARPGTKDYGVITVLAQAFTEPRMEFTVPRHLFRPAPKVDSAVVSLRVLEAPRAAITDEGFFKRVVKSAFAQRRKVLSNALKAVTPERGVIEKALEEAGVDPMRRGETLTLEEFGKVAEVFYRLLARG